MKKYILPILTALLAICSCNESEFLKEEPKDFMSANNSYITKADFDAATTELYYLVRKEFYGDYNRSMDYLEISDIIMVADPLQSNLMANLDPTADRAKAHWERLYKLVSQANVAISRLEGSELTDAQKLSVEAEARFFRAFAYRTLAYLYGGVPLVLEEVTSPRKDYVRATKDEVLAQVIEDAKFAADNLADIKDVTDGKVSSPAALFLLTEVYLAAGKNQEAVDAATKIIDNSSLALMKDRFGSRASEDGDVYWDLFRRNNQNRSAGNTEGIWVIQEEADVQGGGAATNEYFWYTSSYWLERFCSPQVGNFRIIMPDGTKVAPFNWPIGDMTGGRGIGTFYSTPRMYTTIWDDANDIRNSEFNFPRKFKYHNTGVFGEYAEQMGEYFDVDNPNLPEGFSVEAGYDGGVTPANQLPNRFMCGYQTKCTTPFNHPDAQYIDKATYLLSGTGGKTYTDQYLFRLAEVYLLRAEAYLNLSQTQKAADDINVVRSRAHASACTASQVNIDYILDERMREFGIEEKRYLTLSRTGKTYDRVTKYNPYYAVANSADGVGMQERYSLYPIPQSVIEANTDAVLTQNPGY